MQEHLLEDSRGAAVDSLLAGGMPSLARPLSSRSASACEPARRRTRSSSAAAGALGGPLHVFAGTFNVNGKACSEEDLLAWFAAGRAPGAGGAPPPPPPEIYAAGFQEFVDLNAQSIAASMTGADAARRRECQARIAEHSIA